MQTINSPNPLHQDCLGKLQRILDLAMLTAETASTEGNHKIVLQAVREVTRIITLMTKISSANQKMEPKSKKDPGQVRNPFLENRESKFESRPQKWEKSGKLPGQNYISDDIIMKYEALKHPNKNAGQLLNEPAPKPG
jgi:hypothetical protein